MPTRKPPERASILQGTLDLLILRTLARGPHHGHGIALGIQHSSNQALLVDHGSLYPALQRMLIKGWVQAEWGISETNRKVRFYKLTPAGRKQLQSEMNDFDRVLQGIQAVLSKA